MLSQTKARRCNTAVAWTVHEGKTLLVQHKKLGIWLAPGGHVEDNELPHHAAEREFFEETGITVIAISAQPLQIGTTSEYLPVPFAINLHTINKPRGNGFCEQHFALEYFVRVVDLSGLHQGDQGILDVRWFSQEEISNLHTSVDIKNEAYFVFEHFPLQ